MTKRMLRRSVVLAVFFLAAAMKPTPVLAGFEWKAPIAPPPPLVAPPEEVLWDKGAMPAQKVQEVEAGPIALDQAVVTAAPQDIVSGFGADLPLLVALKQVVPREYKFSLAAGVDAATKVSWNGEKPWRQVLAEMLSARGLGFNVQDNVVVVMPLADTAGGQSAPMPLKDAAPAAPSRADMIPEDMISDGAEIPPVVVRAEEKKQEEGRPQPVTIRREKPEPSFMDRLFGNEAGGTAASLPPVAEMTETAEVAPVPAPVAEATAPAAEAKPVSEKPAVATPVWRAIRSWTLKETLSQWSKAAQVELHWTIDYDYKLGEDVAYGGTFEEAVGGLFDQFIEVRPQPYGRLHRRAGGGGTLIVSSYDLPN